MPNILLLIQEMTFKPYRNPLLNAQNSSPIPIILHTFTKYRLLLYFQELP